MSIAVEASGLVTGIQYLLLFVSMLLLAVSVGFGAFGWLAGVYRFWAVVTVLATLGFFGVTFLYGAVFGWDVESGANTRPTGNSSYFIRDSENWWRDRFGRDCRVEDTITRASEPEALCP